MELSFAEQSQAFLWSLLLGAALGVLYGVIKFIRFTFISGKTAVFLLDTLFMLVSALAVFLFSVGMIRGYVRFYVLLGAFLGFAAYRMLFGRLFFRLYRPVVRACHSVQSIFFRKSKLFIKKLLKSGRKILYNVSGKK
ncbi:MAG: spore cortex biosynthesis protein YabQ [Ruminococcus sp.]|nr:spore cortex biosynthesis protein YabQ [Ruminococcus sp.]